MKNVVIALSLLCFLETNAQIGTSQANNSRIRAGNDGTFFYYQYFTPQGYTIPVSENKGTIHSASIWLSAKDANSTKHLSAVYLTDFGSDFTPGPISNEQSSTTQFYKDNIYVTDVFDINDHKRNPSSQISSIYNWPANGSQSRGEPTVIAPFMDLNNDNIYQPEDGEYPIIYGDRCIYSIYNDKANQGFSKGSSMGLDIHQYTYQLSNSFNGDTLENTNFIRFVIVNRSDKDYSDFRFGTYVNMGIGNPIDDYIGTDSNTSMAFGYNGDDIDEGFNGYSFNPPMQGAMFLNTTLTSSTAIMQDNNPKDGLPSNAVEYINYVEGKFKDGSNKTRTGQNLSYTSLYDYFGNLNYEDNYSEGQLDKTPGDRNVLLVAKPAYLGKGDTLLYDMAFPYARVNFGGNTGAYDSLITLANHIKKRYNSSYSWIEKAEDNKRGLSVSTEVKQSFSIYPNPSTGLFTIKGLNTDNFSIVTNLTGQTLKVIDANTQTIDLSEFETGIYFLQTEIGSVRLIKL
jgi:hypothetical protein